jgi:tetratricopeptide (TPR) repeat protein
LDLLEGEVCLSLAGIQVTAGQLDAAASYLAQTLALRPDAGEAACQLGVLLYQLGRLDEAVTLCRHGLEQTPFDVQSWLIGARALHELGRHADCVAWCQEWLAVIRAAPLYASAAPELERLLSASLRA